MLIFLHGGRGTGKTTSAKILARSVNCLNPQDGEPCNECEVCKGILNGSLTDVVEMDAASNRGVDDIRIIRDEVNFLPTKARYRIYIIDEVHMLTTEAFNALLKTLEEPPEHVKFILATTEPQKIPLTILSRCQRFDYKKINNENIVKRLNIICEESKINITDDALETIAELSEGAMRDAISILERCSQESVDEITIDVVKDLVGLPKIAHVNKITKAIFENDEITALETIDEVINDGKDLYNFLWEIIKYIKDILVYKSTGKINLYSESEIENIKELSEKLDKQEILSIIYKLSDLENSVKQSTQKTILFQVGIIKICAKRNVVEVIEKEVVSSPQNVVKNVEKTNSKVEKTTVPQTVSQSGDWKEIVNTFRKNGKMMLFTCLMNTALNKMNDQTWEIEFPNGLTDFNKKILEDSANRNELNKAVALMAGHEINIVLKDTKNAPKPAGNNKLSGLDGLGIDINIID